MNSNIDKKKILFFSREGILNLLFLLFPVSLIAGNLITNLNTFLIILLALFFYKKKIFQIKFHFFDKLIVLFFITLIISSTYNGVYFFLDNNFPQAGFKKFEGYEQTFEGNKNILKSILFLRYLLLYFIIRFCVSNNILNVKNFIISVALCSIFLSIDLIIQFTFGTDIFGFKAIDYHNRKFAGPFKDELIAGGYLQRFSLLTFYVFSFLNINQLNKYKKYLLPLIIILVTYGIFISGNRMPLLLFIFSIFLIISINKGLKKILALFLILFSIGLYSIYNYNEETRINLLKFQHEIKGIFAYAIKKDFKNENAPLYLRTFVSFYEPWKANKFFGGGVKNFRYYCLVTNPKSVRKVCNRHPHNYYLEILTETGLVGFILILTAFIIIFYKIFYQNYLLRRKIELNDVIFPFMILFFIEIFPIRSSGSFFTTNNATYLFLLLGFMISLVDKKIITGKK